MSDLCRDVLGSFDWTCSVRELPEPAVDAGQRLIADRYAGMAKAALTTRLFQEVGVDHRSGFWPAGHYLRRVGLSYRDKGPPIIIGQLWNTYHD